MVTSRIDRLAANQCGLGGVAPSCLSETVRMIYSRLHLRKNQMDLDQEFLPDPHEPMLCVILLGLFTGRPGRGLRFCAADPFREARQRRDRSALHSPSKLHACIQNRNSLLFRLTFHNSSRTLGYPSLIYTFRFDQ